MALTRITGRYIPSYLTILVGILKKFPYQDLVNFRGHNTRDVLQHTLPLFGLDLSDLEENLLLVERSTRPLLCTFALNDREWSAFSTLGRANIEMTVEAFQKAMDKNIPEGKKAGHAIVLLWCERRHYRILMGRFKNSWGNAIGDKGSLWIDLRILQDLKFYDVFFRLEDIQPVEAEQYRKLCVLPEAGTLLLQEMLFRWNASSNFEGNLAKLRHIRACQVQKYVDEHEHVYEFDGQRSHCGDLLVQRALMDYCDAKPCSSCARFDPATVKRQPARLKEGHLCGCGQPALYCCSHEDHYDFVGETFFCGGHENGCAILEMGCGSSGRCPVWHHGQFVCTTCVGFPDDCEICSQCKQTVCRDYVEECSYDDDEELLCCLCYYCG